MLPSTRTSGPLREPKAPGRTAPTRVFLAEDDSQVAMVVIAALRRDGHNVTHLLDGAVAWEHLQHHAGDYDLLILDVNMPGLDGLALAQRVRAGGLYAGRLMIMSGRLGSDDLRQIGAVRVDCVLNKPFDVSELLEAVRDSVRRGPE
jgi:DNA-binding response OmpR family regulator